MMNVLCWVINGGTPSHLILTALRARRILLSVYRMHCIAQRTSGRFAGAVVPKEGYPLMQASLCGLANFSNLFSCSVSLLPGFLLSCEREALCPRFQVCQYLPPNP